MRIIVSSVLRLIMNLPEELRMVSEVALAMLLGGMIGFEREAADKPAGFRTHMLVAGASALLVGLSAGLLKYFSRLAGAGVLATDPIRIVQAVMVGISFLGAGTILRRPGDSSVQGLTTAASLLLAGAVGIAVVIGLYLVAAGVTVLAVLVLNLLGFLENRVKSRSGGAS